MWGSGGGPRTQRRHASGQGRQARFGPSHSQVLPTCLGLICRFRERVRRSGRVGTRKRREGRAPNTGAARGWEQEGPGGQSSQERFWPSGAMLPQTLPLQPCAGLGAQADQTSRSPGQSGRRELRAMGWQEESPSPRSPLCPAQVGTSPMTAMEKDTPWPQMPEQGSPPPPPCPYCSSPSPALCTAAGSPGLGVGVHLGPGRQEGLAVAVWDGAGCGLKGMGVAGVGAVDGGTGASYSSLESLVLWLGNHLPQPTGKPSPHPVPGR